MWLTKLVWRMWIIYYTCLWCFRAYVWNPLGLDWPRVEKAFDNADYYVRKLVARMTLRKDK